MGLLRVVQNLFSIRPFATNRGGSRRRLSVRSIDKIETLESRLVLYAATGNAWPASQLVTISFQPDGTNLGGVTSNLNQSFNNNSDLSGRWQTEILRAAQYWSQVTNLNFAVVTDNGAASGSGQYQQGDPGFGDIRIGGYNFGNSSLARALMPPAANNYSIAGDIAFNTGVRYGVGNNYDLFTVAVHEFGHALGLDHTSVTSSSVMWTSYNGIKTQLAADDVAGIRSIYSGGSGRSADVYDAAAANGSFAAATDVTSELVRSKSSAVIDGLDLTSTSDVDFYQVTVPKWAEDSLKVSVQAAGLSLLTAKLTVYAADQKTVLGTANGISKPGSTLGVSLSNIEPGQKLFFKVEGADSTAFSVGTYGLIVDFGAKTAPTVATPKTTKANGRTLSSSGGVAEGGGAMDEFLAPVPVIQTISPDTGVSSSDRTTNSSQVVLSGVGSILGKVEILMNGTVIGSVWNLLGTWSFTVPGTLSDGTYSFAARGTSLLGASLGVSDTFTVKIDTQAPDTPVVNLITGAAGRNGALLTAPALLGGTAGPGQSVTVFDQRRVLGSTTADGTGNWTFDLTGLISDGAHSLAATSTDQAGNVSVLSAPQSFVVDSSISKPEVMGIATDTGESATDNVTQTRQLTIQGKAEAGSLVTVARDGSVLGITTASEQGLWIFAATDVSLDDGTYRFSVIAQDAAGHISEPSNPLAVTIDNIIGAPSISYVTKTSTLLLLQTLSIQGQADAGSQVQVYSDTSLIGTTFADAQGNWSLLYSPPLLSSTSFRFQVSAKDLAGNQANSSTVYNFVSSSSGPAVGSLTLSSPAINTSAGWQSTTATPVITGTATKGSVVKVFDGGTLLGTAVANSSGRWTFASSALAKGRHILVAVASEGLNHGLPSSSLVVLI